MTEREGQGLVAFHRLWPPELLIGTALKGGAGVESLIAVSAFVLFPAQGGAG